MWLLRCTLPDMMGYSSWEAVLMSYKLRVFPVVSWCSIFVDYYYQLLL